MLTEEYLSSAVGPAWQGVGNDGSSILALWLFRFFAFGASLHGLGDEMSWTRQGRLDKT